MLFDYQAALGPTTTGIGWTWVGEGGECRDLRLQAEHADDVASTQNRFRRRIEDDAAAPREGDHGDAEPFANPGLAQRLIRQRAARELHLLHDGKRARRGGVVHATGEHRAAEALEVVERDLFRESQRRQRVTDEGGGRFELRLDDLRRAET